MNQGEDDSGTAGCSKETSTETSEESTQTQNDKVLEARERILVFVPDLLVVLHPVINILSHDEDSESINQEVSRHRDPVVEWTFGEFGDLTLAYESDDWEEAEQEDGREDMGEVQRLFISYLVVELFLKLVLFLSLLLNFLLRGLD